MNAASKNPIPQNYSQEFSSRSLEETLSFAKNYSAKLKPGAVLALTGDLGSGKTTFIKGLAAGLGLKDADEVKSPTFALMHVYQARFPIYHFDLYRLDSAKEVEEIGFEEFINDPKAISCVEWAEKAGLLLPPQTQWLRFEVTGETCRRIQF